MNKSCDCHICVHASVFLGAEPCLPCHPDENGGTNFEPREYPEYKTLQEIVDQLVWCGYECEGGPLRLNTAFIALQKRAENEISAKDARIKELEAVKMARDVE